MWDSDTDADGDLQKLNFLGTVLCRYIDHVKQMYGYDLLSVELAPEGFAQPEWNILRGVYSYWDSAYQIPRE